MLCGRLRVTGLRGPLGGFTACPTDTVGTDRLVLSGRAAVALAQLTLTSAIGLTGEALSPSQRPRVLAERRSP